MPFVPLHCQERTLCSAVTTKPQNTVVICSLLVSAKNRKPREWLNDVIAKCLTIRNRVMMKTQFLLPNNWKRVNLIISNNTLTITSKV